MEGMGQDERRREGHRKLNLARKALEELHRANPLDPLYHEGMGQVEMSLGRYTDAVEHLEQAVVDNPSNSQARYQLAMSYARTRRQEWAIIEIHKALTVEPRFALGYRWLIGLHLDRQEWGRAAWWLERFREELGPSPEVWRDQRFDQMEAAAHEGMERTGASPEEPATWPCPELLPEGVRTG